MLKTEKRSRSISFTGDNKGGQCSRARLRPLASQEAEQLLKNVTAAASNNSDAGNTSFLHPALPEHPTDKRLPTALSQLTSKFTLTDQHLLHIEARMMDEVNRGLGKDTNAAANVKSFITYVHELPTGRESGQFLALDLGGTNFRVILAELEEGSRSVRMKSSKHEVSHDFEC